MKQGATALVIALLMELMSNSPSVGKFVLLPGFGMAMMLGGSFDEPGRFSERTTVTLIYVTSFVLWAVVAFCVLRVLSKRAAA